MTLTCPNDHPDIELVNDNGAEYPETRIEWYECAACGARFRKVLTA